MGLIDGIVSGSISGTLQGIGSLAKDLRQVFTGEISPEKKAEMQAKLLELEFVAQKAQTDINIEEAKNPNLFIAGWRPAAGWTCVFALAWAFILLPTFVWISQMAGSGIEPPKLQTAELITLLLGMLGIGGLRTFEKYTGTEKNR
ncbi:MAG: 3TM-type holin [Endomicrobiia bacterium]|nr:3TM-type holin [Endomicrobiia bacterium]